MRQRLIVYSTKANMKLSASAILLLRFVSEFTGRQQLDPVAKRLLMLERVLGGSDSSQRRHFLKNTQYVVEKIEKERKKGDASTPANKKLLEEEYEIEMTDKTKKTLAKCLKEYKEDVGVLKDDKELVDQLEKILV